MFSFAAIGQYDALFHRWLGTGVSPRRAVISGASAIAVAQMAGLGLLTGTLARWRALPELSAKHAFLVTQYVSFSFMIALGVLTALAVALLPVGAHPSVGAFAAFAVMLAAGAAVTSLVAPRSLPLRVPPLILMGRLSMLLLVDVLFGSLALYALLPTEVAPAFGIVFAAFLVALSAGLLSGAPGGFGPFELCLLALLPDVPDADLLATVLAFRLIYYVLPVCAALPGLIRPMAPLAALRVVPKPSPVHAEARGLARLADHELLPIRGGHLHVAAASQSLVAMGDMSTRKSLRLTDLTDLVSEARARGLSPALYKTGARSASVARRSG